MFKKRKPKLIIKIYYKSLITQTIQTKIINYCSHICNLDKQYYNIYI